jgi:plasmid stabilization system protein ParE
MTTRDLEKRFSINVPHKGLELTASSVRSSLAPASGSSSGLGSAGRLRFENTGNYCIIYRIEKKQISILTIRHEKQILPIYEILA